MRRGRSTTLIVSCLAPHFPDKMSGNPWTKPIKKACSNETSAKYAYKTLIWAEQLAEKVHQRVADWDSDETLTGVTDVKIINLWDAVVNSANESGDPLAYT
jgi:hypothetical protein